MSDFTSSQVEEIMKAMHEAPPPVDQKVPLRKPIAKVEFSSLTEEKGGERGDFADLKVRLEVLYGKSMMTLQELLELQEGGLLPLGEEENAQVEIVANGRTIGRGEIVATEGRFGVRITQFERKVKL
jgi:flagellar motor switch protein FliN